MADLDPSQRRAACADHPVQLVLAGPGAGKTSTLVGRFHHLRDNGVDPRRIMALTFTKKAAEEMRGRIARDLALDSGRDLRVYTFHSLALRCLQRNPHLAGLPERIDVWSTPQQRAVFSSRRMFWNDEGDILDIIAGAKEQLLDARHYAKGLARDDEAGHRAAEFFTVYEAALQAAGAIDFADMVPLLLRAIAANPDYGRSVAGAVDHLLVDEYQDINLGQHRLIEHFRTAGVHLWAVGDDDQTLFTFRAADIRFTLDFKRRHRDAILHLLDRNYRSTPEIVAAAKRLIARNRDRFRKDYEPARDGAGVPAAGTVAIRGYATPDVEVRQVTRAVQTLIRDGMAPEAIAILYRAGSAGLAFQGALETLGIAFDVRGAGDLWQSAAAKLYLGSLFYLLDADDRRAIEKMGTGRRGEATRRKLDKLPDGARRDFLGACRHARRVVSDALPQTSVERERRDWGNLCDAIAGLALGCTDLDDLMDKIAEQSRALRTPSDHAVVLSTVHSAKGLEWDAVFVVGLEEGVMPSAGAEIEEERRVAYVAVTRAKRILGLTYAAERGGAKSKRSRFVAEFAGDALGGTHAGQPGADDLLPLGPPYGPEVPAVRGLWSVDPAPAALPAKALGRKAASKADRKRDWSVDPADMAPYAPDPEGAAAQWTARDDAKLHASFAVAGGLGDICAATGKAPDAVMSRLVRLKLLKSKAAARGLWGLQ
jgi:DNA helicase-2/ATP-dependent DNA helicase PcrA